MPHEDSSGGVEHTGGLDLSERRKLMRDGLINNAGLIVSGLVGIVIVPLMLKWLGAQSYGIWIVATAITTLLATADFGLYPSVVREVSSGFQSGARQEAYLFLEGAGNIYLLLGLAGALLLGTLGPLLSTRLQLHSHVQEAGSTFFWLIGAGFLVDQLNVFGAAVLIGLRRFDYVNVISSGATVFRAAGIVLVLVMGGSLVAIAVWQVVAAVTGVVATFLAVRRFVPQLHLRVAYLHWKQLRSRLPFALSSLITTAVGGLAWQSGSLLIGLMEGSVSVVPFYVGKKFPHTVARLGWQTAEGVFPAAAENQHNLLRTREIMSVGTRWVMVLLLPVTTVLWIVGPNLLTVWIGKLDPVALRVLRLVSLAALADAFMAASLNVLWSRAKMRNVVLTLLGVGVGTVVLTLLLLPRIGVAGAAWGALLPIVGGAISLFCLACHECQASMTDMASSVFRGLLVPLAACATAAYLASSWDTNHFRSLFTACLAGPVAYLLVLYVTPGQNEERRVLHSAVRRVTSLL